MKLHEGIKKAVEMRTDSIIMDYQFINMLSDFNAYAEFPSGKSILKKLCSTKYVKSICNLAKNHDDLSQDDICNEIDRIAYVMSGEYSEEFDLVRYCCESIAYGIGLLDEIDGYYTVDNFKHAAFIGRWDFEYKNGKIVELDIYRNEKAVTSTKIEFNWKPVTDDEIELYIPGIISYRGKIYESLIQGSAKREFTDTEWNWMAKKKSSFLSEEFLSYSNWKVTNNHSDIDDFELQFLPKGLFASDTKGTGHWYIDDNCLLFSSIDGFLSFCVTFNNNCFVGKGKNQMGYEWETKLSRI